MRRIILGSFALACLLALSVTVPVANAQLRLVAQKAVIADTTVTPSDPTVLATTESPEIFALDVPSIPSSAYVQFTSSAVWLVSFTGDPAPRANLQLTFTLTSPALAPDVVLKFGLPLTFFRYNANSTGAVFQGGTGVDSEVFSRKLLADLLLTENSTLTEPLALGIADDLFRQGFHVSVAVRLRSQNISEATVSNPNVAFFAQPGSED